jgi:hypothetical protein
MRQGQRCAEFELPIDREGRGRDRRCRDLYRRRQRIISRSTAMPYEPMAALPSRVPHPQLSAQRDLCSTRRSRRLEELPYLRFCNKRGRDLNMRNRRSRRSFLRQSAALVVAALSPRISFADAVPPTAMSAELVAAAQKEGKVVWYASVDLPVAEKVARGFEAKYPGISVRVERWLERLFSASSRARAAFMPVTS